MESFEFSSDDVPLLLDVLSVNDSMLNAAYAVKLVERIRDYPIESPADFNIIFERFSTSHDRIQLGSCAVTLGQVRQYLIQEYFPIESRERLISSFILAFENERIEVLEALRKQQEQRPLGRPEPEVS